jgi:hypothetical protein
MIPHETSTVNAKSHYFQTRDYELAEKVDKLPDLALIGAFEVAALSGVAVTSIQKPEQRKKIGLDEPRVLGRLNKWKLGDIRTWLQVDCKDKQVETPKSKEAAANQPTRRRGRPTKAESVAASRSQYA